MDVMDFDNNVKRIKGVAARGMTLAENHMSESAGS